MEPVVILSDSSNPKDTNNQIDRRNTKAGLKNSGLKKCFTALVDRKQVNLELEILNLMLKKEMQIPMETLDPDLATILPYLLVHYIKTWPGWQRSTEYFSGKILFKAWYEKFCKFITLKLNQVIELHYHEAQKEIRSEKAVQHANRLKLKNIYERNTQTDNLAPKGITPFTIEITSNPLLLNTIVFTDTNEGNIILKQHSILEWDQNIAENITFKQIITWPHVGVHLTCPVFSFSRKNVHKFCRHISVVGTPLPNLQPKHIEDIKIIDPAEQRQVYTVAYLRQVIKDLLSGFSHVFKSTAVMEAFNVIFEELLLDIEEMNILQEDKVTMASNTLVLFNIGRHVYFRNKKLAKGPPSVYDIGFTEMIIPKMETSLGTIASPDKFQSYLEHLKQLGSSEKSINENSNSVPQITFSCDFCSENFENIRILAHHIRNLHKMEQPMLCALCKKSFSAFNLTKSRWTHNCNKK